jgi:hypothetical protein
MRTVAALQDPDSGTIHLGDIDVVNQKDDLEKRLAICHRILVFTRVRPSPCWSILPY